MEQPYVVHQGIRTAVDPSLMNHFGLCSGQTVSHHLVLEIMRASLARATRMLDEQAARSGKDTI